MNDQKTEALPELPPLPEAYEVMELWGQNVDVYHKAQMHCYANAYARAVLSAAASPAAPWHPIETAPKDGRKLILAYRNRNGKARTVMARWVTDEEAAEIDADDVGLKGGWYECIENWDEYCQVAINDGEPSHWMMLPGDPK